MRLIRHGLVLWMMACLAHGAGAEPARGKQLFETAGCSGCHTSQPRPATPGEAAGLELPARSRILTKLRTLAAILQDREANPHLTPAQYCHHYGDFAREHTRVRQLIHDGNPLAPMPSWQQRSSQATTTDPAADIDAIIDYLLVSEGQAIDPAMVARWRQPVPACAALASPAGEHALAPAPVIPLDSQPQRRAELLARLNHIDRQTDLFRQAPAVSFLSYQNYLYNKISLVRGDDIDIWLLRQADLAELYNDIAKITADNRFPNHLLFLLVVDKTVLPYRAYYFERPDTGFQFIYNRPKRFLPLLVVNNRNTLSDAATNGCFECHASGPIRLRPRQWDAIPALDATAWQRLAEFNRHMLGYGHVTTDFPTGEAPLSPHDREQLTTEACQSCHDSQGIRAPLLRYHSKVIVALMNAHERADGYYEYSIPIPNMFLFPHNMKTLEPSIAPHQPAAMPPLMPLSAEENERLFQWIGTIRK